jgi:hypothetical protein
MAGSRGELIQLISVKFDTADVVIGLDKNGRLWKAGFNTDGDSLNVRWIEIKEVKS